MAVVGPPIELPDIGGEIVEEHDLNTPRGSKCIYSSLGSIVIDDDRQIDIEATRGLVFAVLEVGQKVIGVHRLHQVRAVLGLIPLRSLAKCPGVDTIVTGFVHPLGL